MELQIVYTVAVALGGIFFTVVLHRNRVWTATISLLVLIGFSLVGANILGANFVGLFGLGACLTCPTTVLMLLLLIVIPLLFKGFGSPAPEVGRGVRRWLYFVGSLVILYAMLAPWIAAEMNGVTCNNENRAVGMTIVEALEAYQADNGTFPEALNELVPAYLDPLPAATCYLSLDDPQPSRNFYLDICSDGETLLYTDAYDLAFLLVYNLETGAWQRASMFDGACSILLRE